MKTKEDDNHDSSQFASYREDFSVVKVLLKGRLCLGVLGSSAILCCDLFSDSGWHHIF